MNNLRPMAEVGQCLLVRRIFPHKKGLKLFKRFYPSTNSTVILRQTTFVEIFLINPSENFNSKNQSTQTKISFAIPKGKDIARFARSFTNILHDPCLF